MFKRFAVPAGPFGLLATLPTVGAPEMTDRIHGR
jgi:hypothetical protein